MKYEPDLAWQRLSYDEKNRRLFENQKALLKTYLEHNAISRAQYDKSLGDLTAKMGITAECKTNVH